LSEPICKIFIDQSTQLIKDKTKLKSDISMKNEEMAAPHTWLTDFLMSQPWLSMFCKSINK